MSKIDFQELKQGLVYQQVCANVKPTEYKKKKELLGLLSPSGTTHGWCFYSRKKDHKPVKCDDPDRKGYYHYIVGC